MEFNKHSMNTYKGMVVFGSPYHKCHNTDFDCKTDFDSKTDF